MRSEGSTSQESRDLHFGFSGVTSSGYVIFPPQSICKMGVKLLISFVKWVKDQYNDLRET